MVTTPLNSIVQSTNQRSDSLSTEVTKSTSIDFHEHEIRPKGCGGLANSKMHHRRHAYLRGYLEEYVTLLAADKKSDGDSTL